VTAPLQTRFLDSIDFQDVAVAAAIWLLLTVGSLVLVLRVTLALPADYFERPPELRRPWTVARLTRNAGGLLLIVVGALLSIPGVPGQGVLTMLVGVLLVDFPQRRRLERALLSRPGVLPTLNRLRARYKREPLRPPRG
jgi:hypothetical protein